MSGRYRVPSVVIRSESTPQVTTYSNYTNLAAQGAVTSSEFLVDFAPIFDVFVFMDAPGSLQLQLRGASAGDGSTWRDAGNPYIVTASLAMITAVNVRVPNARARWTLTNTNAAGGAATTVLEFFITSRSG